MPHRSRPASITLAALICLAVLLGASINVTTVCALVAAPIHPLNGTVIPEETGSLYADEAGIGSVSPLLWIVGGLGALIIVLGQSAAVRRGMAQPPPADRAKERNDRKR